MHELVNEASRALSAHDAERLETLAAEARVRHIHVAAVNFAELSRAAQVLTAQVEAARRHLRLQQARHSGGHAVYGVDVWAR